LGGGIAALRICIDRIPAASQRPTCDLLAPTDCLRGRHRQGVIRLLVAVSAGEITPSEAAEIGRLLETHVRTLEITELEQRLNKLEGIMTNEGN
jgi:flavoprotein